MNRFYSLRTLGAVNQQRAAEAGILHGWGVAITENLSATLMHSRHQLDLVIQRPWGHVGLVVGLPFEWPNRTRGEGPSERSGSFVRWAIGPFGVIVRKYASRAF